MRLTHRFFLAATLCVVCGCGNQLSRSKAEDLITKKLGLPQPQTVAILASYSKRVWSDPVVGFGTVTVCIDDGPQFGNEERKLNEWQSRGLIHVNEVSGRNGACNYISANTVLTDDGKKYLVRDSGGSREVRLYDLAFGDITGMQVHEELKVAEVEYTVKRINLTPFAIDPTDTSTEPIPRKAVLALYDDGWRVSD